MDVNPLFDLCSSRPVTNGTLGEGVSYSGFFRIELRQVYLALDNMLEPDFGD